MWFTMSNTRPTEGKAQPYSFTLFISHETGVDRLEYAINRFEHDLSLNPCAPHVERINYVVAPSPCLEFKCWPLVSVLLSLLLSIFSRINFESYIVVLLLPFLYSGLRMCGYVYVNVWDSVSGCVSEHLSGGVGVSVGVRVWLCVCVCVCIGVSASVCLSVCVCCAYRGVCMRVGCVHVCVRVNLFIFTYAVWPWLLFRDNPSLLFVHLSFLVVDKTYEADTSPRTSPGYLYVVTRLCGVIQVDSSVLPWKPRLWHESG